MIHFYWYKPNPTEHRKFVRDNVEAWLFCAAANVSISWALALIVDIIPGVIRFVISIAWGHVSEVIKSRLELYTSVKEPIKPVLYAASCWISWVILFNNIFNLYDMDNEDASRASYTPRVSRIHRRSALFSCLTSLSKGVPSNRVLVLPSTCHMRSENAVSLHRYVGMRFLMPTSRLCTC